MFIMYVPIKRKTHLKENKRQTEVLALSHMPVRGLNMCFIFFKITLIKETLNQTADVCGEFVRLLFKQIFFSTVKTFHP